MDVGKVKIRDTRQLIRVLLGIVQLILVPVIILLFLVGIVVSVRAGHIPGHSRLFAVPVAKAQSSFGRFEKRVLEIQKDSFSLLADGELDSIIIPVADTDILFYQTSYTSRPHTSTWSGEDGSGKFRVLLTLGGDHLFARITTRRGTFLFRPQAEPFTAVSYEENPEYEMPLLDDEVPAPASTERTAPPASAVADDGSRIDMMVAYTVGMAAEYPDSQIDTRIQYLVDLANLSFQNSRINTRFNLVHSQVYVYTDDSTGDMNEALEQLTDNTGIFAGVETLREQYGADQVTLLRTFVDEGCGLAWVLTEDYGRYAYAVVHDGDRPDGYYCSEYTYVHEVGHNLGCAHDRANAAVEGRFDYSYGYQDPAEEFRTVMAYNCDGSNCPRIPYFSNPEVLYDGKPTGVVTTDPQSAYNGRTIQQTRIGMASYMPQTDGLPNIFNPPLPAIMMMLRNP